MENFLLPANGMARPVGPIVLAILDGIGWGPEDGGNAVHLAVKPNLKRLWQDSPTRTLRAHGTAVGMPSDADMGNSEVGHNALGAGRVFRQGAALVQDAIGSGRIWQTAAWQWLIEPLRNKPDATLHLCGLLSDGNVHAHIDHVFALIRQARSAGVRRIRIHALADGRDVADPSFDHYIEQLQAVLDEDPSCDAALASGGGRMRVTMDRYEADWRIVERGWQAHVHGNAPQFPNIKAALQTLRAAPEGGSDQTLDAFVITDARGEPVGPVREGDSFVLWNFRGDRAIELSQAFDLDDFPYFSRGQRPDVRFAGMMQYDGDLHVPARYLVEPPVIERTLGEYLAAQRLRTFACSETQKFGHVTYFWNGNRSGVLAPEFEEYAEVTSDRIAFDQAPAMKCKEITDLVIEALSRSPRPDFVRLNYANGDMVGHTGNLAATVKAVEYVDHEIGRLRQEVERLHGILIVTADHGNADDMWMRDGKGRPVQRGSGVQPKTSHTLAPVPLTIMDARASPPWSMRDDQPNAGLAQVAATILALFGLEKPGDYQDSLIQASCSAP